jgi:hypothetical protein
VFIVLVSEVDGMKKNDNDELGVHRYGFGCCNTRKKAKMTSTTPRPSFGSTCDEKKLGR